MIPDRLPSPSRSPASQGRDGAASALEALSALEFEALQWSVRLGDEAGTADRLAFKHWLAADGRHREAFIAMQADLDAIAAGCAALPAEALASLRAGAAEGPTVGRPPEAAPARRRVATVLAAGLAALMIGGAGAGWWHWRGQPLFNDQFATRRGQQLEAALPDGSRLMLDTATVADVALYRHRREVRLPEGQILFEVRGDAGKPFDVLAGATRITVIGTRFSVRYAPSLGSEAVEVAVLEGQVRVAPRAGEADPPSRALPAPGPSSASPAAESRSTAAASAAGEPVDLHPGQIYRTDDRGGRGTVVAAPIAAMAAWRDQRLAFDDAPLSAVLAEIERYQPARVRLRDAAAGELTVTASVDLREIRAFIRHLPSVLPVRVTAEADGSQVISLKR